MTETAGMRWTGRMRGGRFGNLFFAALARGGGLFLVPFFLFWVALYFLVAAPSARRISFDLADRTGRGGSFLRRLRFAFRHFYAFGTLLVDRVAIRGANAVRYRFENQGEEHIRESLAGGRGVILLAAHFGNSEVMGQLLAKFGTEVTLVMFDDVQVQPELRETVEDISRGRNFRILFTDGSPATAAAILSALSRGGMVGMMGDRVTGDGGIPVRFLGGTALFPTGPFALAAAAGAPVVQVFAIRISRRRYRLVGLPPIRPGASGSGRKKAELAAGVAEFAGRLEEAVLAHPEQWGNFFPFWKERSA
jgi:predicted LPLAT superfamily acyltransferase